jgi:putative hemolysin
MSTRKLFSVLALPLALLLMAACTLQQLQAPDENVADMANPAAVFCEDEGYKYEIRTADDGSESGVCIFDDGSECGGWAFFRGECAPGNPVGMANPAAVFCEEKGYEYEIRTADDGSQSGACIFGYGSECDGWAFFRGECSPGTE